MSAILNFLGLNKRNDFIVDADTARSIINLIKELRKKFDAGNINGLLDAINAHAADVNDPHHVKIDMVAAVYDMAYPIYIKMGGTLSLVDFKQKSTEDPVWFFEVLRRIMQIPESPSWRVYPYVLGGEDYQPDDVAPAYHVSLEVPDFIAGYTQTGPVGFTTMHGYRSLGYDKSAYITEFTLLSDWRIYPNKPKYAIPVSGGGVSEDGHGYQMALRFIPDSAPTTWSYLFFIPQMSTNVGDSVITMLLNVAGLNTYRVTIQNQNTNNGGSYKTSGLVSPPSSPTQTLCGILMDRVVCVRVRNSTITVNYTYKGETYWVKVTYTNISFAGDCPIVWTKPTADAYVSPASYTVYHRAISDEAATLAVNTIPFG